MSIARDGREALARLADPSAFDFAVLRVFDRFFTTARATGGSGIGLSIVRAVVEAHGGAAGARSVEGEGEPVLVYAAAKGVRVVFHSAAIRRKL